jgi:hypothetical protein
VPYRPLRPRLAAVALLALGDYLLWNWSLGANHDVLALVCGVTLVPLLIALAWLLVVAAVRLLARIARSTPALTPAAGRARGRAAVPPAAGASVAGGPGAAAGAGAEARNGRRSPSSKLAA